MRQLSIRSNKIRVALTYRGDGIMAFQVPVLQEGATVLLWFKKNETVNPISGLFTGREGVFRDIIRNAFFKKGGITLNGYLTSVTADDAERPAFRTVIQPDADMLCQVDRAVLERKDCGQLIFGYDRVRHQFLKAFRYRIRFLVLKVFAFSGGCLSLWGIVKLVISVFSK